MTNTERKLDEAKYFLDKLNPNDPYFDYILSAYLNSARSTSWIMRHEFHNISGWEDWFKSCEISTEEFKLLKRINELRILSTKKSGIKTEFLFLDYLIPDEECYTVIENMINDFEEGDRVVTSILEEGEEEEEEEEDISSDGEYGESYRITGIVKLTKDESELSRESIDRLCKSYFAFLERHVKMCVGKFRNT